MQKITGGHENQASKQSSIFNYFLITVGCSNYEFATETDITKNKTELGKNYPAFRKHPAYSMLNDSFRNSLLKLIKSFDCHATRSSRVPPVEFLSPFFPRYSNLLSIHLFGAIMEYVNYIRCNVLGLGVVKPLINLKWINETQVVNETSHTAVNEHKKCLHHMSAYHYNMSSHVNTRSVSS